MEIKIEYVRCRGRPHSEFKSVFIICLVRAIGGTDGTNMRYFECEKLRNGDIFVLAILRSQFKIEEKNENELSHSEQIGL